jgi:hypothetical protein
MSAETVVHKESTTYAADSAASERRKRFWNQVIGWGVGLFAVGVTAGALITPLGASVPFLATKLMATAAELGMAAGEATTAVGILGRIMAAFRK